MNCYCCQGETKRFGKFQNKNRIVQRYRCLQCGKTFSETQPLDSVRVDFDKACQVVNLLVEGCGIRAISRLTGLSKPTILHIVETVGEHATKLHDAKIRDVKPRFVQADELWSYNYCKQANVKDLFTDHGDQYTFLATDKESKLIISYFVGRRNHENTDWFARDLRYRTTGRFQLTTDGWNGYTGQGGKRGAISKAFGQDIDYGTEIKTFGHKNVDGQRQYSPPPLVGVRRRSRIGNPDLKHMRTSHAERCNLSVRLFNRRFTRLTLGYSKKLQNHQHAVALFVAHFNFCRVHSAHKMTPAQAARLTDHVWTIAELLKG